MNTTAWLDYLEELSRRNLRLRLLQRDVETPLRTDCNPHVHEGYELKLFPPESGTPEWLLELVPPHTVHESTLLCHCSVLLLEQEILIRVGSEWDSTDFTGRTDAANYQIVNHLTEALRLLLATRAPERLTLQVVHALFRSLQRLPTQRQSAAGQEPEHSDYYQTAVDYINHRYYHHNLSVSDVAGKAGCSVQYLNRIFRRQRGCGVRQYLIFVRLHHARRLLESHEYLVSDVAKLTGWSCPFYFCNSFKKQFGVAPNTLLTP